MTFGFHLSEIEQGYDQDCETFSCDTYLYQSHHTWVSSVPGISCCLQKYVDARLSYWELIRNLDCTLLVGSGTLMFGMQSVKNPSNARVSQPRSSLDFIEFIISGTECSASTYCCNVSFWSQTFGGMWKRWINHVRTYTFMHRWWAC